MSKTLGIPNREDYGDTSALPTNKLITYVDQLHRARRAGTHHDIRVGDKALLSWAGRHGTPNPGEKRLLFQQPLHSKNYANFEGEIPEGYGAGTVSTHDRGTAIVTEAGENKIKFLIAHHKNPEYFTLIKSKGKNRPWLMVNTTPQTPEDVLDPSAFKKIHLRSVPAHRAEEFFKGLIEGKVDGASGLFKLKKDSMDVLSYRVGAGGKPIIHTERFFQGGSPKLDIPKKWAGKVLRGEIYGTDRKGRPVSPQTTSPLLNMTVENSLKSQQAKSLKLRSALFGIVGDDPSDPARVQKLQEVLKFLPVDRFGLPPRAQGEQEASSLWKAISAGKHPEIAEGVVAYPEGKPPVKIKLRPDYDVKITDVFPGEGKYQGSAGGIIYEGGGRVGTGFDDKYRQWLWDNREAIKGRIAKITSTKKLPSGKYYQPSFVALHEDYPTKTAKEKENDTPGIGGTALGVAGAAGAHKLLDSGLTYGVRRGGLFQNYYANAAREGINAAITGQDLMPKWRRSLGIINPSLTGLTDYEVARALTARLLEKGKLPPGSITSVEDLGKNPIFNYAYNQLKNKTTSTKLSPISRNFINALDPNLPKNSTIEFLRTHGGMGVDKQRNPLFLGAAMNAMAGSAGGLTGMAGSLISGSPDLALGAMSMDRGLTNNIEDLKLGLIGAGAVQRSDTALKSKAISAGLNLLNPSSGEVYDFGQDIGKLMDHATVPRSLPKAMAVADTYGLANEAKQKANNFIKDTFIEPGKKAPGEALKRIATLFKRGEEFTPDYTPEQLKAMGVYGEVYGPKDAPRLASLPQWPQHWYHEADPHGWLQWYQRYSQGRRIDDDVRQIKRWAAFKARHGGKAFRENPTPRRAYALRNWAIDPTKLVNDPKSLQKIMEDYKAKKYKNR